MWWMPPQTAWPAGSPASMRPRPSAAWRSRRCWAGAPTSTCRIYCGQSARWPRLSRAVRCGCSAESPGAQPIHQPADERGVLGLHPWLVHFGRFGEGQARRAEHGKGDPGCRLQRLALEDPIVHQRADKLLDEPIGVLLLALAPAMPAERERCLLPDHLAVDRIA